MREERNETGLLRLLRKDEQEEVGWRVGFAIEELYDSAKYVEESIMEIDLLLGRIFRGRDANFNA